MIKTFAAWVRPVWYCYLSLTRGIRPLWTRWRTRPLNCRQLLAACIHSIGVSLSRKFPCGQRSTLLCCWPTSVSRYSCSLVSCNLSLCARVGRNYIPFSLVLSLLSRCLCTEIDEWTLATSFFLLPTWFLGFRCKTDKFCNVLLLFISWLGWNQKICLAAVVPI